MESRGGPKIDSGATIRVDFTKVQGAIWKGSQSSGCGCSLSHLGIYRDMIEKELSYALILEDDAILSSDLKLESLVKLLDTEKPVAILLTPDFWYKREAWLWA